MNKTPTDTPAGRSRTGMTEDELRRYRLERESRRHSRNARRRRILEVAAALIVLVFVAFNWDKLAPASFSASVRSFFGMFASGQFPLSLSGDFKNAVPIGSNVAVLTDSSLTLYTTAGAQVWQRSHGMSDPALVAAGSRAVLFDRGGKQFRVETRFGESFSGTTDYPIVNACVGKSGKFAVVTESGSYLSEVDVYDTTYHSVFKWYSSQGRVLAAALSADGKSLAALTVSAKDGAVTSSVSIFRLGSQKPVASKSFDGTLLFSLQYTDAGWLAAVGDNQTVFISASGKTSTAYSYADKTIRCYDNTGGQTALALTAYGANSQSTLVTFDGSGKVAGQADVTGEVQALHMDGSRLTALRTSDVWYGTTRCKQQGTVPVSGDKLEILSKSNSIYVFGLQAVNRYAVKNGK